MALTKQEIADINSVINKKELSLTDAKNYLLYYVSYPEVKLMDKINLLVALKTIFLDEFNLNDMKIRYIVGDFSQLNLEAFHESARGDNYIYMGVDITFLDESKKIMFLRTMLHEYGHLKMYAKAKSGGKVPKSVVPKRDVYESSKWQMIGALSRYCSAGNERFANVFANQKLNELQKSARKLSKNSYIVQKKNNLKMLQLIDDFVFYGGKFIFGVWSVSNTVFCIKSPKKWREFDNTISYGHILDEENKVRPLVFYNNEDKKAGDYVRHHKSTKETSIKGLSAEKKLKTLVLAFDKYSVVMASKLGVKPDEIGFMLSDYYTNCEYINLRDINPNSPLLGYFIYPHDKIKDVQSIGEFFEELDACYDEKMEEIQL